MTGMLLASRIAFWIVVAAGNAHQRAFALPRAHPFPLIAVNHGPDRRV
jgi:hypothetical protein